MSESKKWVYMLDRAADSKQDFLNYLIFADMDIVSDPIYEEVSSWTEERMKKFSDWWSWDLDTVELAVWQFCENMQII